MSRTVLRPKVYLIDASILGAPSQQFVEQIWTQVFLSVKTAGSEVTQWDSARSKALSVLNAIDLTSQNTIGNLDGIARQMTRSNHLN